MSTAAKGRPERRIHPAAYPALPILIALAFCAAHAGMLRLPLHWDEMGHFVPAALDLYREGAWVPRSVPPNVHPPGLACYLAGVWWVLGYSVEATRAAMLAVSLPALVAALLLSAELCRARRSALLAAALLGISPLFFAQAAMAHLDLPAALFTALALLWFLRERMALAALACAALAMTKETGVVVPLVFAGWLFREGRRRDAALFLLPAAALAGWLAVLAGSAGHPFGNGEFARYNVLYPLHPVRLAMAVLRRAHYLFVADFHWVGTAAALAAWRRGCFRGRSWKIAGAVAAAHTAAVTLLGGAVLERYLLPVLPVLYAAMAEGIAALSGRLRTAAAAVLVAGLAAGNFLDPPYPYPPENNLAWTDYVRLHREAAEFVSARYGEESIATAWPLSAALSYVEPGYARRPLRVTQLPDFRPATLEAVDWERTEVLALFSEHPESARGFCENETVRRVWNRYWGWTPDATPEEVRARLPFLHLAASWSRRGRRVEIYERRGRQAAP